MSDRPPTPPCVPFGTRRFNQLARTRIWRGYQNILPVRVFCPLLWYSGFHFRRLPNILFSCFRTCMPATVPTAKSVADFHRQVIAHAERTNIRDVHPPSKETWGWTSHSLPRMTQRKKAHGANNHNKCPPDNRLFLYYSFGYPFEAPRTEFEAILPILPDIV